MTAAEVAVRLDVSADTVRKAAERGDLPSYRVGVAGRDLRFDRAAVEAARAKVDHADWLDARQVARRIGTSAESVVGMARAGVLPAVKLVPRGWRFNRDTLEQWITDGGAA